MPPPIPVQVGRRTYPSLAAAAEAEGVSRQAMSQHLARVARGLRATGRPAAVVKIDGVKGTLAEHAERLGLTPEGVRSRLRRAAPKKKKRRDRKAVDTTGGEA